MATKRNQGRCVRWRPPSACLVSIVMAHDTDSDPDDSDDDYVDEAGADIMAGQTSRGSRDVSHDDRRQAGASTRSVLVSSLVLRRPAQARSTEASGKGCYIGATRPRPEGRQDGGHRGAQDDVTTGAFWRR